MSLWHKRWTDDSSLELSPNEFVDGRMMFSAFVQGANVGVFGLSPEERLALANALVPDGVFVQDPAGLWALIQDYGQLSAKLVKRRILGEAAGELAARCDEFKEQIRAALGMKGE